jgi:hypothetical protein
LSGIGTVDVAASGTDALRSRRDAGAPRLEYLIFITNQYGDQKVSVYGFGHKK